MPSVVVVWFFLRDGERTCSNYRDSNAFRSRALIKKKNER